MGELTDIQASNQDEGLLALIGNITTSENMAEASLCLKDHLLANDAHLLSIKFYDSIENGEVIRPFSGYPPSVVEVGQQLQKYGGCPFARESKTRLSAFDSCSIDRSQYESFLERRFFKEIDNTGHNHIAVVPIMIGRAIALFTIGMGDVSFKGEPWKNTMEIMAQVVPAFISRFPEIATIFERKHLSELERRVISLRCTGANATKIADELKLSEFAIQLLVKNASRKLEVTNDHQLVYKALALGEIFPADHAQLSH